MYLYSIVKAIIIKSSFFLLYLLDKHDVLLRENART